MIRARNSLDVKKTGKLARFFFYIPFENDKKWKENSGKE